MCHNGVERGCEAAETDKIPSGIQQEGGHDEGEY